MPLINIANYSTKHRFQTQLSNNAETIFVEDIDKL